MLTKKALLIIFLPVALSFLGAQSKKDLKEIKSAFKDMVLIPKGTMLTGSSLEPVSPLSKDSNLLMGIEYCDAGQFTLTFGSLYLSNHEVSNAEYKKFIAWVKDSTSKTGAVNTLYRYMNAKGQLAVIDVMPDTLQWYHGLPNHYAAPMAEYYHNHSEFNSYPVVNVSQAQALAYIHWLNNRLAELLRSHHCNIYNWGSYRLPTALEWEYAASYTGGNPLDENQTEKRVYSWQGTKLVDSKGAYCGNFGRIVDENGVVIKTLYEDDYQYTAPAISYKPNTLGLYNMSGNVSEWTHTLLSTDSIKYYYADCYRKTLGNKYAFLLDELLKESPDWALFQKYVEPKNALYFNPKNDMENRDMADMMMIMKPVKRSENHNLKILNKLKEPIIAKGGSWADGPCYLQCTTNQAFANTKTSPKVGFRVAMVLSGEFEALIKEIKGE